MHGYEERSWTPGSWNQDKEPPRPGWINGRPPSAAEAARRDPATPEDQAADAPILPTDALGG